MWDSCLLYNDQAGQLSGSVILTQSLGQWNSIRAFVTLVRVCLIVIKGVEEKGERG